MACVEGTAALVHACANDLLGSSVHMVNTMLI